MANSSATLSADGQTAKAIWSGGCGLFTAYGTFGGGTVKMQYSPDDGTTWIDTGTDSEFTSNGGVLFQLGPCAVRASLSGSTSPDLNVAFTNAVHVGY